MSDKRKNTPEGRATAADPQVLTATEEVPNSQRIMALQPLPDDIDECVKHIINNIYAGRMVYWLRYWYIGRVIAHIEAMDAEKLRAYLAQYGQPTIYDALGTYFDEGKRQLQDCRRLYANYPNNVVITELANHGLVWSQALECLKINNEHHRKLLTAVIVDPDATKEKILAEAKRLQEEERAAPSKAKDKRLAENKPPRPVNAFEKLDKWGKSQQSAFDKKLPDCQGMLDLCTAEDTVLLPEEYAAAYAAAQVAANTLLDLAGALTAFADNLRKMPPPTQEAADAVRGRNGEDSFPGADDERL